MPHIQRFNTYFTDLPPKTPPPQKQNYMQLNNELANQFLKKGVTSCGRILKEWTLKSD